MESIHKLSSVLTEIQHKLQHVQAPWLVGGSCGLLLQDVPLMAAPRDLDLYADEEGATEIHLALMDYSVDEQCEDRSGLYRSVLSHYIIDGVKVELVGGFEITAFDCFYKVEAAYLHEHHAAVISLKEGSFNNSKPIRLMPLEHELLFNVLRNRPDRYQVIARVIRTRNTLTGFTEAFNDLLSRNQWNDSIISRLKGLLK